MSEEYMNFQNRVTIKEIQKLLKEVDEGELCHWDFIVKVGKLVTPPNNGNLED